ncbi:hypothetical protein AWE51_15425 [Aquimarina aggregata]|uniref:Uncharacterized protein n=1 Tax=Aquimarina aggregata TaxID=1642818 RepID=A0A163CU60_9FLAO|nr:hypothetical protein [Aquimarina aggregata]KZS42762.1 hypothetical protein AWE51_15425 [Aquimarina aggregata]
MKTKLTTLGLALLILTIKACSPEKKKPIAIQDPFIYDKITPVNFPKVNVPNFKFPEDSTTLNEWIRKNDTLKIYTHGWGIWAGLTQPTSQTAGGQNLLVFETWLTPEEMIDSILQKPNKRSNRANLKRPNQFTHFGHTVNDSIHESVSYSPSAANHAIKNKLFLASSLYEYAKQGKTEIPIFPDDAITIKPVFKILPVSKAKDQKLFAISTWPGTIDSLAAFPEKDWHSAVYIDITNHSHGDGNQLYFPNSTTPPEPTAATTYDLSDFIHYTMNKEDAHFFNQEFTENTSNPMTANPGDIVILVGMHVNSRENTRWTWQTFWWVADPDNPAAPSSQAIANQRPKALTHAASHYAMAVAYYMINPEEPNNGVNIQGNPNYAFNPYLEAGFGPDVFNKKISQITTAKKDTIPTYAGVRTNCMSCHSMATVNTDALNTSKNSSTPYIGDAYIPLNDSIFTGQLKLDFAWSIQGNIDTTGFKTLIKKYTNTLENNTIQE